MKILNYFLKIALFLHANALLAQAGITAKTVQVGVLVPISAAQSEVGLAYFKGAQTCAKSINDSGTLSRKIVLLPLNDINDSNEALSVLKESVNSKEPADQIFSLMGLIGDPVAEAVLPYAVSAQIPVIGIMSGSDLVVQYTGAQGVFSTRLDDVQSFDALVKQLTSLKQLKLAIVTERNASGVKKLQLIQSIAKKYGATIVSTVEFVPGENTTEAKSPLLVAAQPDAVISLVGYFGTLNLMKAMRAANYTGMFAAPSSIGVRTMVLRGGKSLVHGLIVSFPQVLAADSTLALVRDYRKRLVNNTDDLMKDDAAFEACIAIQVFAEGVRRMGSNLSREGLKSVLNAKPVQLNELTMHYGSKPTQMSFAASTSMVGADGYIIK